MAGHPQGTNRGLKNYAGVILHNSTGDTVSLTNNSTGLKLDGGIMLSGKSTGQMSATSTAGGVLVKGLKVGAKTTYFSSNSTGVKLGSKYITGNSTAN